ncbi:hypothetical protein B0H14DRAFT_3534906 [Mycena olivaceomarginata]|nr:hypothetical protein B0H14DRAFT_3534906 [Mycena olivaceomarginata]
MDTSFTKVLLHRLFLSKTNRAPLLLSLIMKETSSTVNLSNEIIVSGGTITDDIRLTEVPKLTINAAKERILTASGKATMTSSPCGHLLAPTSSLTTLRKLRTTHPALHKALNQTDTISEDNLNVGSDITEE